MRNNHIKIIFWAVGALIWSAALLYFTLIPAAPRIDNLLGWDKLQHAAAFGTLGFFVTHLFQAFRMALLKSSLLGFAAASLFGGLIEILQGCFTATRQADLLDFAADAVGALIVLIFFVLSAYRGEQRF